MSTPLTNQSTEIESFQDFAAHLSHAVFDLQPNQNNFLSPLSIQLAISLLLLNSKNKPFNLNWEENLSEASQKPLEDVVLDIANTIYHDATLEIRSEVKEILTKVVNSGIKSVDFKNNHEKVIEIINNDVEEQTKGLIKNLVSPAVINQNTASVLLNCIYFKGKWQKPFQKTNTKPFSWKGSERKFNAMFQKSKLLGIRRGQSDGIEAVAVPYSRNVKFVAVLSRDGKNKPHLANLSRYVKEMRYPRQQDVELVLPKFKNEVSYDLTELFPKFGIPMVTNDLASEPLQVDSVIHKAVIDVDEEGTTAAAATAIMMSRAMVINPVPEEPFHVDREFLYAIYDTKNQRILFSGSFVEPEFV